MEEFLKNFYHLILTIYNVFPLRPSKLHFALRPPLTRARCRYGGFVGYGGGWGTQLMRPAPGYLPDWQYGYAPGVPPAYAPYNAPYYNGYAGPPPAHHQQVRAPP